VTKRTKSSHSEASAIGASGDCFSASLPCRRASRRPIIVVAVELRMSSVSARMAAVVAETSGCCRKRAYAWRMGGSLDAGIVREVSSRV
tara:strand:+ start:707 stop:973 length:267 start_codon:yes stop_codon:yes gene_type:complete